MRSEVRLQTQPRSRGDETRFPPLPLLLLLLFIALRNSGAHFSCCCCCCSFLPSLLCFGPVSFLPCSLALSFSHLESARDQQKPLAEGLISAFAQRQPASVLMTGKMRRRRRPFLFLPSSSSETASRTHTCQKYKHAVFFERARARETLPWKNVRGKVRGGGGRRLCRRKCVPQTSPLPCFEF